jgi:hypothetical protein
MWHDVEPAIRDWAAAGARSRCRTGKRCRRPRGSSRILYEGLKRILAEYDARVEQVQA